MAGAPRVAVAGPAAAHGPGGPTNERARVTSIEPEVDGLIVRLGSHGLFEVENDTGEEVIVLGYAGEPYLRLGDGEVSENTRSPSTYLNRSLQGGAVPEEADEDAPPDWDVVGEGEGARWYDHRLHRMGTLAPTESRWQVDLLVDGRPVAVRGELVTVDAPARWPWWLLGVGVAVGSVVLYRRLPDRRRTLLGLTLASAFVVQVVAVGAGGPVAWVAVLGSLAAAGLLWRDPVDWVPGLAGVLVAAAGLIELGDLAYDDLVVEVADPLYRAGVVVSIGLGVGLAVASLDLVRRPGLRTP
jgi:hypothetical protein